MVTPCCVHCRLTKSDAWKASGNQELLKNVAFCATMDECPKDALKKMISSHLKKDAKEGRGVHGKELDDYVLQDGPVFIKALADSRELFFKQSACCALYGIPLRWDRSWNRWSLDRGDNKRLHFYPDGTIQEHCRFVCKLLNVPGSDNYRHQETMLEILSSVPSDFRPDVFTDATREAARIALESPQLHSPFFLGH